MPYDLPWGLLVLMALAVVMVLIPSFWPSRAWRLLSFINGRGVIGLEEIYPQCRDNPLVAERYSSVLDRLVEEGAVDKRGLSYRLTPAGRQRLGRNPKTLVIEL